MLHVLFCTWCHIHSGLLCSVRDWLYIHTFFVVDRCNIYSENREIFWLTNPDSKTTKLPQRDFQSLIVVVDIICLIDLIYSWSTHLFPYCHPKHELYWMIRYTLVLRSYGKNGQTLVKVMIANTITSYRQCEKTVRFMYVLLKPKQLNLIISNSFVNSWSEYM